MYRIVFSILLSGALLWGPATAYTADLKIGYVDAAKVLEKAPQVQQIMSRLEKEFEPRKDEVIATQEELKRLEDRLSKDGDFMSNSERMKMEREVVGLRRDLRRVQEDFREDLNLRRNEELGKLQSMVNEAIEAIGGEGNYDLILYDGIAFADDRLDLTAKVLEWLSRRDTQPGKEQATNQ